MVGLAVFCAFEDGVFHEVGEAVLVGHFVAGAGFDHQHEMGDFALPFFMYDSNAVGEHGFLVFIFHKWRKNWAAKLQQIENILTFATLISL